MALRSKATNRGNWALPRGLLSPLTWLKERARQAVGRRLNREVDGYELKVPYSMAPVHEQIRKGDVVFVEGRLRISQLIKYAAQSQADPGKQYDDRNLVHLALMLLSPVQFGQLKSRTIQSCLGNCTDFQRIIATLATSQLGKER